MPLFKEIQDFNEISLNLKYMETDKSEKNNIFQDELKEDKRIREHKDSVRSDQSIAPEVQKKILGKLSMFKGFIEILESNWVRHQQLSKAPTN